MNMPEPSSALNLFAAIRSAEPSARFAILEKMIEDHTEECQWLDFKAAGQILNVGSRATSDDEKQDKWLKEEWSKYLSAFANSGGGLIIWGIATDRDKVSKRDVATKFDLVRDPHRFKGRLEDLANAATSPPVSGIENIAVESSQDRPSGCVVSYIPHSRFLPHRAEHPAKNYWARNDDDCGIMAHELLRHCFYPHFAPSIQFEVKCSFQANNVGGSEREGRGIYGFQIQLTNIGNGTATGLAVVMSASVRFNRDSISGQWTPSGVNSKDCFFCHISLHPKLTSPLGNFIHHGLVTWNRTSSKWVPAIDPVRFTFETYAENQPAYRHHVTVSADDLLSNAILTSTSEPV
jgi:hypothetical protein